jgi:hypothetical protein
MDEKVIYLECGCTSACCILRIEYLDVFDELYLSTHPKWKHKPHGVIINKEKAKELRDYLNEFLKEDEKYKITK